MQLMHLKAGLQSLAAGFFRFIGGAGLTLCLGGFAATSDTLSVRDFGAKGDGRTDDTAAFQKALDSAAQAGGGAVQAGRGNFFFAGHLDVPNAVTLEGIWKSVPAHNGLRDRGLL
jgi:hypothetical protein